MSVNNGVENSSEEVYLRCSVENNIIQPDVDHIEEPMIKYRRPTRPNLEQSPLGQELFQHGPR